MYSRFGGLGLWAASALVVAAGQADATNGYLQICAGANNCGVAGAGVALSQDATDAGVNPAGLAGLGSEVILSPAWFHPVRTMNAKGPLANPAGEKTSRNENFLEGAAGANYRLSPTMTVGLSAFGSGGMTTKYSSSRTGAGGLGGYDTRVRYRLANVLPTVTWSPTKKAAYGASVVVGYADFKTDFATLPVFARTAGANRLERVWGAGFRVGAVWEVEDGVKLGLTAASPTWFQTFEKHRDVFLGPLDTPPRATLGVAVAAGPDTDIAFDIKWIGYNTVKAIGTAPIEGGFGWDNQFVVMLGVRHRIDPRLTLRAGVNFGPSPLDDDVVFANALFPAVVEYHLSAGASYKLSEAWELSGSAFYVFESDQTDPGTGDAFSTGGVGTEVKMYQLGAQAALKWTF